MMLNGSLLPNKFNNIKEQSVFATGLQNQDLSSLDALQSRLFNLFNLKNFNYLDTFNDDLDLLKEWLTLTRWLRFDCIVLDYLRINHLNDGILCKSLDWIILNDDSLQLAFFTNIVHQENNKPNDDNNFHDDLFQIDNILSDDATSSNILLQVWYTYEEFQKWIIQYNTVSDFNSQYTNGMDRIYDVDNSDMDSIIYTCVNLEILPLPLVRKLLQEMKNKQYLDLIYNILFNDDTRDLLNIDLDNSSASSLISLSDNGSNSSTQRKTKKRKIKVTLNSDIKSIMEVCIKMKNLNKIICNGFKLFDLMINAHGFRDRSGNTISYIVKNRTKFLQLNNMPFLNEGNVFTDLTRWNNLIQLKLNDVNNINLNNLIIPETCSQLIIKNCQELIWWDIYSELFKLKISHEDKFDIIESCPNGFDHCLKGYCQHKTNFFYQFDETDWLPEDKLMIINCLTKKMNRLNIVKLIKVNISNVLIIPRTLYMDERFIFKKSSAEKLILI